MAGGIGVPIGTGMSSWLASAVRAPTSSIACKPPNTMGAAAPNCGGEKDAECGVPLAEEVAEVAELSVRLGGIGLAALAPATVARGCRHMNFKAGEVGGLGRRYGCGTQRDVR